VAGAATAADVGAGLLATDAAATGLAGTGAALGTTAAATDAALGGGAGLLDAGLTGTGAALGSTVAGTDAALGGGAAALGGGAAADIPAAVGTGGGAALTGTGDAGALGSSAAAYTGTSAPSVFIGDTTAQVVPSTAGGSGGLASLGQSGASLGGTPLGDGSLAAGAPGATGAVSTDPLLSLGQSGASYDGSTLPGGGWNWSKIGGYLKDANEILTPTVTAANAAGTLGKGASTPGPSTTFNPGKPGSPTNRGDLAAVVQEMLQRRNQLITAQQQQSGKPILYQPGLLGL
jgi:hypothetical protein